MLELGSIIIARVAAALGVIALSIFIGRSTGTDGLGIFTLGLTALTCGAMVARRGYDFCLIIIAAAMPRDMPQIMSRCTSAAARDALILGIAAITVCVVASQLIAPTADPRAPTTYIILSCGLPFVAVLSVLAGYLRGIREGALAALLDGGGAALICAALLAILLFSGHVTGLQMISTAYVAVLAVIALGGWSYVKRTLQRSVNEGAHAKIDAPSVLRRRNHFFALGICSFLTQAGSFALVAPVLDYDALGIARAAERLALLISFGGTAVNPFLAPRFAATWSDRSFARLKTFIFQGMLLAGGLALLPLIAMISFPEFFLGLFGDQFSSYADVLLIFCFAQFIAAIVGPGVTALSMIEGERHLTWVQIATLVVSVVLFPASAIWFGLMGFATSYLLVNILRGLLVSFVLSNHISKFEKEIT